MTPESISMLQASVDRLREQVRRDADESTWPFAGIPAEQLTNGQRRARFWHTKNAHANLARLLRQEQMLEAALGAPVTAPGTFTTEAAIDAEVEEAEREAAMLKARLEARDRERLVHQLSMPAESVSAENPHQHSLSEPSAPASAT